MDMCYDGTLVMPSSYAVMEEDEMCYVEGGGWSTYKGMEALSAITMSRSISNLRSNSDDFII